MSIRIAGTGSALPRTELTNQMLVQVVDTSDEWITERTGIRRRRILAGESLTELAVQAARNALQDANAGAEDVDMILCATLGGDYRTPSLACMVQQALGAQCVAMDINAACTGFLYAMDLARCYMALGERRCILLIGAEAMTRYVDWQDRRTCVLFGDGAGAVLLQPGEDLLYLDIQSEAQNQWILVRDQPTRHPLRPEEPWRREIEMNGQEVYRYAVGYVSGAARACADALGVGLDGFGHFVLHQANARILEAVRSRLRQPSEKFAFAVDELGNTSAASVPIVLDMLHREGRLMQGELLFLCAFGAGMTSGSAAIRWSRR